MDIYILVTTAIFSYLIGNIIFAVIITKAFKGYDIREKGSRKCRNNKCN